MYISMYTCTFLSYYDCSYIQLHVIICVCDSVIHVYTPYLLLLVCLCCHNLCVYTCSYPPEATKCLEKKREVTQRLESKIEAGIER